MLGDNRTLAARRYWGIRQAAFEAPLIMPRVRQLVSTARSGPSLEPIVLWPPTHTTGAIEPPLPPTNPAVTAGIVGARRCTAAGGRKLLSVLRV